MRTIQEIRERYPHPKTSTQTRHAFIDSYCVGGAFVMEVYGRNCLCGLPHDCPDQSIDVFPSANFLAGAIREAWPTVSGKAAQIAAEATIELNDLGCFDGAWDTLAGVEAEHNAYYGA